MNSVTGNYRKFAAEIEFGLSIVISTCLLIWIWQFDGNTHKEELFEKHRIQIYGYLVVLSVALLGVSLTMFSIILAYWNRPRLRKLRQSRHRTGLFDVLTALARSAAGLLISALIGMVWYADNVGMDFALIAACFFLVLCVLRLLRTLRLVRKFVVALTIEPGDGSD